MRKVLPVGRTRLLVGLLSVSLVSGGGLTLGPGAVAAPPTGAPPAVDTEFPQATDELPNPLEDKRRALRQEALTQVVNGKAAPQKRGASTVVKVGESPGSQPSSRAFGTTETRRVPKKDQYVELSREKTDRIFVVLVEFGNERHPDYPDQDTDPTWPGPADFDGPVHNGIPEPDRKTDNSTIWQADYSQKHFQELYFSQDPGVESVANYYKRQSSGRYTVDGVVTDWVKVKYNQARYGRSDGYPCASNVCENNYQLIPDAVNAWVDAQKTAGRTTAEIEAELATFDQWDRYDFDGDGDFNEPDGYLDHFQLVHAGGDQAASDPIYGEDAIWSHRGYAFQSDEWRTGPANNKLGGAQVGDTKFWVGDYTIQPENGGLGVFAHEYGHDLGLPDHYDTSYRGESSSGFWTIMASGSYLGNGTVDIGSRPGDFSAWDKLQLGWLDYEIAVAGQTRQFTLGPAEYNTKNAQGLVVVLPKKRITQEYGKPFAGSKQWWSQKGDDLRNSLTREVDLTGKQSAELSMKARYEIEEAFDYLYVQYSTDDGVTWEMLDGTIDGKPFPKNGTGAPGLTGVTDGKWVDMKVPLSSLAGKKAKLRLMYRTDGALTMNGFFADDITLTVDGQPVLTDGAETVDPGWTSNGWITTTGTETGDFDNYYIAENRNYVSYDTGLKTGPYNFGFLSTKPDWVEHYPYQEGLLISYWDTSQADNNVGEHPGEGLILPIDSHPQPIYRLDGRTWNTRIQVYDAPFGLRTADSFPLHVNGRASYIRGQAPVSTFDDTRPYWFAEKPDHGVKVPITGTGIQVVKKNGLTMAVRVFVTKT